MKTDEAKSTACRAPSSRRLSRTEQSSARLPHSHNYRYPLQLAARPCLNDTCSSATLKPLPFTSLRRPALQHCLEAARTRSQSTSTVYWP